MNNHPGIYAIVNKINGHRYIGSAVNMAARWRVHTYHLRKNNHHSKHLQAAWNKYGKEQFDFVVLEVVDNVEKLIEVEQKYLDKDFPEYNTNMVAGSVLGFRFSTEAIKKMSESHSGFRHTEESKNKMSEIWSGKPRGKYSEERVRKMSEGHKGLKPNENQLAALDIGRRRSPTPEERKRISDSQKGYKPTEETIEKLKAAWVIRKARKANAA